MYILHVWWLEFESLGVRLRLEGRGFRVWVLGYKFWGSRFRMGAGPRGDKTAHPTPSPRGRAAFSCKDCPLPGDSRNPLEVLCVSGRACLAGCGEDPMPSSTVDDGIKEVTFCRMLVLGV